MIGWEALDASAFCAGLLGLTVTALLFSHSTGFRDLVRYYSALCRLILRKRYSAKRLSNYENFRRKDPTPEDLGLLPYPEEFAIENPQNPYNGQAFDGIHFCGVDCSGNFLDVAITKITKWQSSVWIILKDSSGTIYQLPSHPDTRSVHTRNDQVFSSRGLQIRCLSPLRRWRISFNGLLRRSRSEGDYSAGEVIHVKFSFIWISVTVVHDLAVEYEPSEVAKALVANEAAGPKEISFFQEIQNRYEQWGQLFGTLNVEGEDEKELYLWSARTRIFDMPLWESSLSFVKLFIYFKDGIPLKIEVTSIDEFLSNYVNGYYLRAGGEKCPITNCNLKPDAFKQSAVPQNVSITFRKSGKEHKVKIQILNKAVKLLQGPDLDQTIFICQIKAQMESDDGFGVIHFGHRSAEKSFKPNDLPAIVLREEAYEPDADELVLALSDERCKSSLVSGGKACSLALLTTLSKETSDEFKVPKGFVVTTAAFQKHIQINKSLSEAIETLISVSCGRVEGNLKAECERCAEKFESTNLSQFLKKCIEEEMSLVFEDVRSVRVAVRSSAYGEDSEDMSAAGQMITLLGVQGLDHIYDAVSKCWSSRFRFEAVQYSRQNGFPIDSPMAVVVQEMVPSEVAGVMFTVDPVTGNPTYPCITANFGLGETVVSSAVEPDTITLKRDLNNKVSIWKRETGNKSVQVILRDAGGVEEKLLDHEANVPCLTEEWALKIGNAGLLVEQSYCHPCDIEWAIFKDQLFLLQARPVTTVHNETEFELTHELDTPTRSVSEYWTKANTGEVFPGAVSPLGITLVVFGMDVYGQKSMIIRDKPDSFIFCPYYLHWLPATHRHINLSIIDTLFRANDRKLNTTQKSFEVSLFGREVGTGEMHEVGVKKYGYVPRLKKLKGLFGIFYFSYRVPKLVGLISNKLENFSVPLDSWSTSAEAFENIKNQLNFYGEVSGVHGLATFLSSIYNVTILTQLSRGKEVWDNELYGDFATLLSSCSGIESADVPSSLEDLAKAIVETDPVTFASVPAEMAHTLLKNDAGVAGKKFNDFLNKHGHRCIKEFDVYSISWGMQPINLVRILQNMVRSPERLKSKSKETSSIESAIKKLKTPMSTTSQYFLKFILPRCRKAVGLREKTKSLLIKIVDWMRRSCRSLGHLMVQEGMLPEEELVFFLTLDEIKLLVEIRQNPGLVSRAYRRRRLHPKLDGLQFPEIMHGIPRPIVEEPVHTSAAFVLKGTPVCQGVITARARVVLNLESVSSIQSGDILVANSTDTGWSPYFPLLSGVITVLGGLISHGAVVAREYGLPCVVGVQKATSIIKSGDLIVLDGVKGTITKIVENEELHNANHT